MNSAANKVVAIFRASHCFELRNFVVDRSVAPTIGKGGIAEHSATSQTL